MFSSSCGCGFLINSWMADSVAVARVEAIKLCGIACSLHFRLVTGTESGWGFFFFFGGIFSCWGFFVIVVLWGGFITIWQVICSMIARLAQP